MQLPRHPSSLYVLVVRQHSADGSTFRDFNVRHAKIAQALFWLKMNNHYYANIVINNEDIIARSFVPFAPSSHCEDDSINEVLVRMQEKTTPIVWPNIDSNLINEFNTSNIVSIWKSQPSCRACKRCKACRVFSTLA
ncbi:hypothetical protein RhiirC2_769604 [Rhizophagus irregularis]|uniref:DUF6570 domain-containing protein n=1 Tax=Rhizophagus irregularis TaxID=588596 RepID=A0A2N1NYN6_9GLOM|nr:hypothetical protein RhiirC2_769604 [Rhizophagus irregularis]